MAGNNKAWVAFKTFAPFTKCITKVGKTIVDAEELDLIMLVYNSIKYSSNYSDTTHSLWFYSKHELDTNAFKSFRY